VIACGNASAGDDAAGLVAARRAAPRLARLAGVEVVEAGSPLNAVHLFEEADAAIVVDAVRTADGGRETGELIRLEVGPDGLPGSVALSLSSHGFGVVEALGLAAALGELPSVLVLGVEVAGTTEGAPLSPPVRRATRALADLIVTEAERLSTP
jgi:hydrogenase maturation protease